MPTLVRVIIAVGVAALVTATVAYASGALGYGLGLLLHAGAQAAL